LLVSTREELPEKLHLRLPSVLGAWFRLLLSSGSTDMVRPLTVVLVTAAMLFCTARLLAGIADHRTAIAS
jgi:hypothetical protein